MGQWLRARSGFKSQLGLLVFDIGQVSAYFLINKAGIFLKDAGLTGSYYFFGLGILESKCREEA